MSETGSAQPTDQRETAICTLFEGDYHLGLAALVNSLVRAGFAGTVWAGYRGELPPWIGQLKRIDGGPADAFDVEGSVRIVFLKQTASIHFTNYKPEFMLRLLANEARECAYLWYFDPDVFVLARWSYFRTWQRFGVAVCQEVVDNILPADAPLRKQWMELAEGIGFRDPRPVEHYYNAGAVGVPAEDRTFLEEWKRLIGLAESQGCDLRFLAHGDRERPFNIGDQDALNIALMYTKSPLTTLGPQGMGFVYGASMAMYHAVGPKPWRGSFLWRALQGTPPSGAMKSFLRQVNGPIRAYPALRLYAKRTACLLASLIGRFYRRL